MLSRIDNFAGLRREFEIGLQFAPTLGSAVPAAKAISSYLDADPSVPVRLAGLAAEGSRMLVTIAVTLGSIDAIKVADPSAQAAVRLIARLVDELAAYDPAFVVLPHASSFEAQAAAHATSTPNSSVTDSVRRLVASI